MDRRQFVGRAAASLSLAVGLAGCSGGGSHGDGDGDGEETDADGTDPGADASSGVSAAVDALAANTDDFESFSAAVDSESDPVPASFPETDVTGRVADAREALDDAGEDELTPELESLAEAQEAAAGMFQTYAAGAGRYGAGNRAYDNGRLDDARADLRAAERHMIDVDQTGSAVLDDLDRLDGDVLADADLSVATFRDAVENLHERAGWLDAYLDGLVPMVTGTQNIRAAASAMQQSEYGRAERLYETAHDDYSESARQFDDPSLSVASDRVDVDIDQIRCEADALADATATFADAARAVGRGDTERGEQLRQQASAQLDRCPDSGIR